MLKRDELFAPDSCLNKAAPDEPLFVLRAKDILAPVAIELWAQMAGGRHEPSRIAEAQALAKAMRDWRIKNCPEPAQAAAEPVKA